MPEDITRYQDKFVVDALVNGQYPHISITDDCLVPMSHVKRWIKVAQETLEFKYDCDTEEAEEKGAEEGIKNMYIKISRILRSLNIIRISDSISDSDDLKEKLEEYIDSNKEHSPFIEFLRQKMPASVLEKLVDDFENS